MAATEIVVPTAISSMGASSWCGASEVGLWGGEVIGVGEGLPDEAGVGVADGVSVTVGSGVDAGVGVGVGVGVVYRVIVSMKTAVFPALSLTW